MTKLSFYVNVKQDIKNIIDAKCKKFENKKTSREEMKTARGEAYTEISNKLNSINLNPEQKPRIQRLVPSCVRDLVRNALPDPDDEYVGCDMSSVLFHNN